MILIDTADLQPGWRGRFIQHTHSYQQYKNSFYPRTISQKLIGTYYHPGSTIRPLWTVSRTDYLSVTTNLVPPPPHCDTHLGETSIHQIQIQIARSRWDKLTMVEISVSMSYAVVHNCIYVQIQPAASEHCSVIGSVWIRQCLVSNILYHSLCFLCILLRTSLETGRNQVPFSAMVFQKL